MGRNAVEEDIVLGSSQGAMASRDHHRRIVGSLIGNVGTDEIIHTVQMAVLHDGFRTANAFLRWLEDQLHSRGIQSVEQIYLMTVDEMEGVYLIQKEAKV